MIFEQHFAMLKSNEELFLKYKKIECIEISDKMQKDFLKTGKQLLKEENVERFLQIRSIHYYNVVMKKLEEYSLPEWFICISEKVLLEYAIPVFLRVLNHYPMLCGINNEWQVMYEISKIDIEFWNEHRDWKVYLDNIIDKIFLENKEGKLAVDVPEEYLIQFKIFKEN